MKVYNKILKKLRFLCWLYLFFCYPVFASETVADVASNLSNMTDIFDEVFKNIFYVIGIGFVTTSLIRYREHRMNPSQTPIGRVLFLLLFGLIMGFCPFMIQFIKQHMQT